MNDEEFLKRVKQTLVSRVAGLHEADPAARVHAAIGRARWTEGIHRTALALATAIGAFLVVGAGILALATTRPSSAPEATIATPVASLSPSARTSPAPSAARPVLDPGLPAGERIVSLETSVDGRFLAVLGMPDGAPPGTAGTISVLDSSGARVADATGTAIAWVGPRRLALLSVGAGSRLVVLDVASRTRQELGTGTGSLLGDGVAHLAIVAGTTTTVVDLATGARQVIHDRVGLDWHGSRLLLVQPAIPWSNGASAPSGPLSILDVGSGRTSAVDPSLAMLFSARFSPDGATVACDCFPAKGVKDALGVVPGVWLLRASGGGGVAVEPVMPRDLGAGTPPFAWLADGDLALATGSGVRVVTPAGTQVATRALGGQLAEGFVPATPGSTVLATAYAESGVQPFTWLDGEGRTIASATIDALTTPLAAVTANGTAYAVDPISARTLLVLRPGT